MSDYLHGIETEEKSKINLTIADVDTSSVVVIGTSLNNQVISKVTNFTESAKYLGENIDGLTLAEAAETILTESGGADIYTINILNNEKHSEIISKSIEFINGKCKLDEFGIQNLILTKDGNLLVEGQDYDFIDNTIIILSNGAIEEDNSNVEVSYKYLDLSKIEDSDVIGKTDDKGKRTGIQQIWDIIATYSVVPGIIIAPGFASKNVRNALENIANEIKAFVYFDGPKDLNVPLVEKARYKETNNVDLTSTDERSMGCIPWVYRYNSNQNTETLKPLTPVAAGIRVRLDKDRNIAKSIDNTVSKTITKVEFPISFMLNKKDTDSNRINALGITTVINHKGEYRIWGARNSSYPNKSGLMTFESARRTRDFISKSIENSSFECIGENITKGFVDNVLNAINSKFAAWSNPTDEKNYIIYGGEAYYDETLNTAESIANGHFYIPYDACPLATVERITYHDILDISIITKTLNS